MAIALHWTIAATIALQLFLGWHMQDLDGLPRSTLLQLHRSIGIAILLLTAGRLYWRYKNPPPAPESSLTPLELKLSHWVHMGFYGALFALPLTGWAMASMEQAGGMSLFGLIPWPSFPIVGWLPGDWQDNLADLSDQTHSALVWVMLVLMFLHIAGALKHHFISRDPTVARMLPGVRPGALADSRLMAVAAVVAVVAALVYFFPLREAVQRPKPANLASADLYLDVVQPAMVQRCGACHSDDQSRGGLSISSYDTTMRGGREGKVVTAGNAAKSDLYVRVTLPAADKRYMPKGEHPSLTPSQVAAMKTWIEAGAPRTVSVGSLNLPSERLALVQQAMGRGDASDANAGAAVEVLPVVAKADPAVISALEAARFVVRPVDKQSNLLDVNYTGRGAITAEDRANLSKISQQARTLSIRYGGLSDADAKTLSAFPNLIRLRIEGSPITDASAPAFAAMKNLRQLGLVKTKLTDAGLNALATAPKLQRIYVWQTPVTKAGAAKVEAAHPAVKVDLGLSAADVDPHEPVVPVIN